MTKEFLNDNIDFFRELKKNDNIDNKLKNDLKKYIDLIKNIKSNLKEIEEEESESIEIELRVFRTLMNKLYLETEK